MSSTRYRQQPLQIYQDPVSYDHAPMPSVSSSSKKTSSPLRPIKNASSRRNIVLNPPSGAPNNTSPHKSRQQTSSSPSQARFTNKLNMISMPPPGGPSYNTDSMKKKQPSLSRFKTGPQKALFTTFSSSQPAEKENYYPGNYPPTGYNDIMGGNYALDRVYGQKGSQKRVLTDSLEIQEKRPLKKAKTEQEPVLPATFESFPVLHDDGSKPQHSYATLIGMAILRAPNRRLTLAQIYKWISDTYSFYNASEAGWQNSIRHNLSLNKSFVKQERPKDDPGKGNYWAIEVGQESQFFKEKPAKKSGPSDNMTTIIAPATQPCYQVMTPRPQDMPQSSSVFMPSEPAAQPPVEPSSDATIPASDVIVPEEEQDTGDSFMPHAQPILSSPPPAMMNSSPPIARPHLRRDDTPPPVPRFPTSSITRSHKRSFASMDDSGYFSSLNSSVLRGAHSHQLTSEGDRPRIKRGRAEEEIARLRGSSYDSPTKGRAFIPQSNAFQPPSSSPIRRGLVYDSSQMLPPLTPAVKLKAPVKPPPSVSPNTNLRMHRDRVRQLVGSPERGITCLDEFLPWSPAFQLDDGSHLYNTFNTEYDIFADTGADFLSIPGNGSPEKRSAKRPGLDRAPHSANVLTDISNLPLNKNITSTPILKFTSSLAPSAVFKSPTKMPSPSKYKSPTLSISAFDLPQEDFGNSAEFLTDDMTEFSGMDILQGFQKIGAGGQGSGQNKGANGLRPNLGRSFTSRF